jgi:hypothetical protein
MINETVGFPVKINALVSDSEPFGCECASLPTGECCPLSNMEVKDGVCVLCMDPSSINTVMVDGCGRCKPGTRPLGSSQQCVVIIPILGRPMIALNVSNATKNDRNEWVAEVGVDPGDSAVILFLAGSTVDLSSCTTSSCLAGLMRDYVPLLWDLNVSMRVSRITRELNPQYLQFDRGRLILAMNESTIRSWAQCSPSHCAGNLVGVFVTLFDSDPRFTVRVISQPLSFELIKLRSNSVVCGFSRGFAPVVIELHHHIDTGQYLLWPPSLRASSVQWGDDSAGRVYVGEDGMLAQSPPDLLLSSMRVFAGDKQYFVPAPVVVIPMHSLLSVGAAKDTVRVQISYGLALKAAPEPGDTEQLVTISAYSKQPVRLTRLSSAAAGVTTLYTAASKGFIVDPTRALDLVVACNGMMSTDALVGWLGSALGLMGHSVEPFVRQTCERSRAVSKLYWLVPYRPIGTRRNERVDVKIFVDFV